MRRLWTLAALFLAPGADAQEPWKSCPRTVRADVVALDQGYQINRLGTARPGGLLFALAHDVVATDGAAELRPGKVQLRADKRPRPMVLRANVGDCLEIRFRNLLAPKPTNALQPVTRTASIHMAGMQVRTSIASDGTWAGANPLQSGNLSGVVEPGGHAVYALYAAAEGAYLLYSTPGDYNGFGTMQLTMGLFGALIVEPAGSEWYRSQVTEDDLRLATTGTMPDGHPQIHYEARYPAGHPRSGRPILRMLDDQGTLVHSDLTAVITGPGRGRLSGGPGTSPILPERDQPFREVTVHYHESQDVVQAFPYFIDPENANVPTVNAGMDSFAINYGLAGIGPEVLANRLRVGPAADCAECKFEEFFLSSWAMGDPGMVVDVPANFPCTTAELESYGVTFPPNPCAPDARSKATRAFYPDDPSNVYHSYLGDHVRFRILHAGASVHHVHHHHAHQWLHQPLSDGSNYLDSQSIGPGSSYTLELVYDGSGNRNLTVGDSIFHCHFYPHFASGMWALFRVHDVFEAGTPLDAGSGRPRAGTRALPDGEIAAGTPIPAVVPLPTRPMAPLPAPVQIVDGQVRLSGDGFPGFPFYIPGRAGRRAPHPPLDFAVDPTTQKPFDGGLPRHLVASAEVANEQHTLLDWSKDLAAMTAYELPEKGTAAEQGAMRFFGQHLHPSFTPEGRPASFRVNGLPRGPQSGAPFADPAVAEGKPIGAEKRVYKGVNLQLDTVFNKAGWHYPQQRMMALWGDVPDLVSGQKPPEPLFFRAGSNDVVEYWHTNLVPSYYELDDFQVRTPTDILGQHIHLVKFDVTSSDGAANGFNYEDGTFSPEEVRDRITSINAAGGLWDFDRQRQTRLQPKAIPELGEGPGHAWLGAQATVQRWWVDPLMDAHGNDRTYMTVFTHDHFGPSTHQMIGLYGGLLVEPPGTTWTSLDGKTPFRTRDDGGPTSYAANILYGDPRRAQENYREFALAWGDLQFVYGPGSKSKPDCYSYTYQGRTYEQKPPLFDCNPVAPGKTYLGWADPANVINCPRCTPSTPGSPQPAPNPPTPLLIGDFGAGMLSLNYRGEPLPLRIAPAAKPNPKAGPEAADLAHAFRSIERLDPAFSAQPTPGARIDAACQGADCFTFPRRPISGGMEPTDPFTPLLHGYQGDKVQVRLLSGAHTSMHDFTLHGQRWKFEPFSENSGYRNSQFIVLSEHFEMLFDLPKTAASPADYIYNPTASYEGLTNGIWGLLRSWDPSQPQPFLAPLRPAANVPPAQPTRPPAGLSTDCARVRPCLREFEVHVLTAGLLYNTRGVNLTGGRFDAAHPLVDPNALVYVRAPKGGAPPPRAPEPLVLRAAAGDWIHVKLVNKLSGQEPVFKASESASRSAQIPYAFPYSMVSLTTSATVGLHPQLVDFDVTAASGINAGLNPVQTAAPGGNSFDYYWYAGRFEDGRAVPVEYGAVNLMPADPLMQVYRGLFGALVIEPEGSQWVEDPGSPTAATVWHRGQVYREFVLMVQDDVNLMLNGSSLYAAGNPLSAFNYRSEPFFYRFGKLLDGPLGAEAPKDWTNLTSSDLGNIAALQFSAVDTTDSTANRLVGGEPQTPILRVPAGMPVRLRVLSPGGIGDNQQVFELSGHSWQEEPFTQGSTKIGFNPQSDWTGTISGLGPTTSYEIILEDAPNGRGGAAGGRFRVPGDYLYRSWTASQYQVGLWGLFRVAPWKGRGLPDTVGIRSVGALPGGGYEIRGFATVSPTSRKYAPSVTLTLGKRRLSTPVAQGLWSYRGSGALPSAFTVTSPLGGTARWGVEPGPPRPPTHLAEGAPLEGVGEAPKPRHRRRQVKPRQPR